MLTRIKTLLELADTSKDAILEEMIIIAQEEALAYTNRSRYITPLDSAVVLMVVEKYRKLGTEGLASQSYSEVSESFAADYSKSILSLLSRYKVVRFQ